MEKLFGLDMNVVAAVASGALALILAGLTVLAWRGRVMFKLGLRPIPRRPAQSALIVLGLMLASLIITAAFVVGDTLSHTLRSLAVESLGQIDEEIRRSSRGQSGDVQTYFRLDRYDQLAAGLDRYDHIDQLVPAIREQIPVVNATRRQSERYMEIMGLRAEDLSLLDPGETRTADGVPLNLADLGANDAILNAVAARSLGAAPGDELKLYANPQPTTLFVRAITAGGSQPRLILPLRRAQMLFNQRGNINTIFISNAGDTEAGAALSAEVTTRLRGLLVDAKVADELFRRLAQDGRAAEALRQEAARRSGNLRTDLLALADGLHAGALSPATRSLLADETLSYWVLRVLDEASWQDQAARDRVDWLFAHLSDMTVYTNKRNRLEEGEDIASAATALFVAAGLFSIASGLLLIFLIFVMLAAERKPEMGMTRALGGQRRHLIEMFVYEGTAYDLAAAAVGVALGVGVGFAIAATLTEAIAFEMTLEIRPYFTLRSLGVAYSLGMLVTFATVLFSAYRVSRLNIVAAIRDLPEPASVPARLHNRLLQPLLITVDGVRQLLHGRLRRALWRWGVDAPLSVLRLIGSGFKNGSLTLLFGLWQWSAGRQDSNSTAFGLGVSFTLIGAGLLLRGLLNGVFSRGRRSPSTPGRGDRLAFTALGLALVVFWALPPGTFRDASAQRFQFGPEFFFLSGLGLVGGAVTVLMFNSDLLLGVILRGLGGARRLAPILRMAVAYPLASRFRTGLTLGIFAVVVFSVVFIASVFTAQEAATSDLEALTGGYHLRVATSYSNPLPDLKKAISADSSLRAADYAVIASQAYLFVELRQGGGKWLSENLTAVNPAFLEHPQHELLMMAPGYETAAEVWRALRDRPGYALIDRYSVPERGRGSYGSGFRFELQGVYLDDQTLPPIVVEARDPASRATFHLTVIGVFEPGPALYGGLVTSQATLEDAVPSPPAPTTHYVRLADGIDPASAGRALESAFLRHGLESTDLADQVRQEQRSQRLIATLLQAFLTLGLVVGVAALGVISTRAVVERRQQIGMLRALGFRSEMVGWSFLLESSFVALLGIGLGAGLGLIPAYQMIREAARDAPIMQFQVPWGSMAVVVAVAYAMTLLTTWLPAAQAARIPPAEALRYE